MHHIMRGPILAQGHLCLWPLRTFGLELLFAYRKDLIASITILDTEQVLSYRPEGLTGSTTSLREV